MLEARFGSQILVADDPLKALWVRKERSRDATPLKDERVVRRKRQSVSIEAKRSER